VAYGSLSDNVIKEDNPCLGRVISGLYNNSSAVFIFPAQIDYMATGVGTFNDRSLTDDTWVDVYEHRIYVPDGLIGDDGTEFFYSVGLAARNTAGSGTQETQFRCYNGTDYSNTVTVVSDAGADQHTPGELTLIATGLTGNQVEVITFQAKWVENASGTMDGGIDWGDQEADVVSYARPLPW